MASLVSELGPAEGELYFLLCKFNTGTTFVETDPTVASRRGIDRSYHPASRPRAGFRPRILTFR
jgi:hypothetical protein